MTFNANLNKRKFRSWYLLGEGYPRSNHFYDKSIALHTDFPIDRENCIVLDIPEELEDDDCPKYRLILERIE